MRRSCRESLSGKWLTAVPHFQRKRGGREGLRPLSSLRISLSTLFTNVTGEAHSHWPTSAGSRSSTKAMASLVSRERKRGGSLPLPLSLSPSLPSFLPSSECDPPEGRCFRSGTASATGDSLNYPRHRPTCGMWQTTTPELARHSPMAASQLFG